MDWETIILKILVGEVIAISVALAVMMILLILGETLKMRKENTWRSKNKK